MRLHLRNQFSLNLPKRTVNTMTIRSTNNLLVKLLFFHLVLLASFVYCQSNISSTTEPPSSDRNKLETVTTTTVTPTTTVEVLLSGNEFVDFTETPTLMFDGVSNENDTSIDKNVTSSPLVPTNSNTTQSNPLTNETTNTTTSTVTTEPANTTTILDEPDEEEESEPESDGAQDASRDAKHSFNPPQNVSQYMDYIERLFHDLRHQITDLFEPHIPQLIRTSQLVQLSGSCSYDMLRLALALRQFEPWALRMIDSSGKVPEGIFEGSFTALGSYDECLSTVFTSSSSSSQSTNTPSHLSSSSAFSSNQQQNGQGNSLTQGKYCLVNVSPFLPPKPPVDRVESMFQEEANKRNYTKDDQFSRLSPMFYYMKFRIGVCIPSTCIESDLESISSALSSSLRLNITIPHCRVEQSQPITVHQLAGGLVFAVVLMFVVGATMMDYSRRKRERLMESEEVFALSVTSDKQVKEGTTQIPVLLRKTAGYSTQRTTFNARLNQNWSWMSFSCLTNYKLYFKHKNPIIRRSRQSNEHDQAPNESALIVRCLNGIRVLSLCWVIIANSYITLDPRATKRLTKTREAPKDFIFQMVAQASLAIETFFFLSGVLMSLSFSRKLNPAADTSKSQGDDDKKQRPSYTLQWIHFYIHRYIRMTPATMLVIAFTMFAYSYGDGPLWFEATHKAHESCNENWWRHLLHIANYIDTRQMCFIHYWYIAADMQLFLFAPILMFLLYQRRRIGYAIATLIGLISIGSVFYTTYIRNLPPTLLFYNSDPESRREFGNTIMTKPLTHALPYMVGMLVGKWLTSCRQEQASRSWIENERSRSMASVFGLLATFVALAEVFLPYKWNNSHLPTRLLASAYAGLFRFGWSLVLAYIVVSCRHKRTKRCRDGLNSELNCCSCKQQKFFSSFNNIDSAEGIIRDQQRHHHYSHQQQGQQEMLLCICGSGGNLLNRLLSLSIFTHLSKLSFVAYLIHLPLMSVFVAQTRGLFAFSHTLVIHLALSYLFMTFILSFLLVHIIEFPFITFERYLFEKLFYKRKPAEEDLCPQSSFTETYKPAEKMRDNKMNHQRTPSNGTKLAISEKFHLSERL